MNIEVTTSCDDERRSVTGTHVLLAVGRVPNTDDLGLTAAGIETNAQGLITVDDELRTTAEGVWALASIPLQKMIIGKKNKPGTRMTTASLNMNLI